MSGRVSTKTKSNPINITYWYYQNKAYIHIDEQDETFFEELRKKLHSWHWSERTHPMPTKIDNSDVYEFNYYRYRIEYIFSEINRKKKYNITRINIDHSDIALFGISQNKSSRDIVLEKIADILEMRYHYEKWNKSYVYEYERDDGIIYMDGKKLHDLDRTLKRHDPSATWGENIDSEVYSEDESYVIYKIVIKFDD